MRVSKKRSQLLALVGLGLEVFVRDEIDRIDDVQLLASLEEQARTGSVAHPNALYIALFGKALNDAKDVSRIYVRLMKKACCALKRLGAQLLDNKLQLTDFEEIGYKLTTLLRILRNVTSQAAKRRLTIKRLLRSSTVTTLRRMDEMNAGLLRHLQSLETAIAWRSAEVTRTGLQPNAEADTGLHRQACPNR